MKKAAEIAKNVILLAMIIFASCDVIVVLGEDDGTMGVAKFFILKITGLAAAYGLFKLGVIISKNNLLPEWWNRMVEELEKDQDV